MTGWIVSASDDSARANFLVPMKDPGLATGVFLSGASLLLREFLLGPEFMNFMGERNVGIYFEVYAESVDAEWPDMHCFRDSKWSEYCGWGRQPSEAEFAEWRRAWRFR